MSTTTIARLELQLGAAIAEALAIQTKLSAAREQAGLKDPQTVFTAAEINALHDEHKKEMRAVIRAILPPTAAVAASKRASTRPRANTASQIIAAGKKRRAED